MMQLPNSGAYGARHVARWELGSEITKLAVKAVLLSFFFR